MDDDFSQFEHGRRKGIFDRCNSRPMLDLSKFSADNVYRDGYLDGWNSCDPRIVLDDCDRGFHLVAQLAGEIVVPWLDENMPEYVSQDFKRGMMNAWTKFLEGAVKNV